MVLQKVISNKLKNWKKTFFCWHLEGQWRKYPDPLVRGVDPDPYQNESAILQARLLSFTFCQFASALSGCQLITVQQCSRSMKFWCGSGTGDPCLWLMDPDPAIFIIDLQDANKKRIKKVLLLITFCRYIYIIFKDKKSKRSHKTVEIKVFLTIFA